ncbi:MULTISPECIES: PH domain-containing protein [Oerskovia]|uniref:PH domain-containing protein n=1 Tax=Oerskovia merdavium TaxID=2762227 RepID=A0ABR8TYX5_9CELL|nr:PH domain-containing protein [Oerskovia merdavium]MBD7980977.1 PH domain-containing protein [Oerskovia merdavium]
MAREQLEVEGAGRPPRLSARHLRRYIIPGERVVLATRAHWGKLAEPVATTFAAFLVVAWLVSASGPTVGDGALMLWWVWLAVALRLLWKVLDWRNEWFVATDKRMLLMFGLVTHKVAMMPLGKVTDMSYSRSIVGRVLGYGQFILESAGQDQAMSRINWVAKPDATYRKLCDTIFLPGGKGGPGGSGAQNASGGADGSAGRQQAAPTAPGPSTTAPPPPPPPPAAAHLAWAPTSVGPERDPAAAATQPVAVRSVQKDGQGHLFVAPRGSAPRLAGTDRPVMAPPLPPLPPANRLDGTDGEAEGPAWEVSDEDRATFVPIGRSTSSPGARTEPPVPPPPA